MREVLRLPILRWHPDKTIRCGQVFHWYEEDDTYVLVQNNKPIRIRQEGADTVFHVASGHAKDWFVFLGLEDEANFASYDTDPALAPAFTYARGLRLLRQDPFVTIISFILSANNHFARIRAGTKAIAEYWGEPLGKGIFAFPDPKTLARVETEKLRSLCTTGYRDRYIAKTARLIADGSWDMEQAYTLPTEEARKYLLQLPGVGPKVADCILLFAYGKGDVFPMDVWMRRVMRTLYPDGESVNEKIARAAVARFGGDAGLVQQMLFYYARDHKLGTIKKS